MVRSTGYSMWVRATCTLYYVGHSNLLGYVSHGNGARGRGMLAIVAGCPYVVIVTMLCKVGHRST